ncbi:MAG TPA: Na+/H+ antiporter NhaC [Salinivirgaceae bacterium]|nr:Na+/H+ antiporter NhaC [Salinivirgaceae bacterium]
MSGNTKKVSLFVAFIPIIVLIILLSLNVYFFGDDTLSGSNQMALLLSAAVAAIIALRLKYKWISIQEQIVKSITAALPAILILLMIGALAGTWMLSGVVPAMIYYGLKLLHPSIFLFATVVICCLVSLATGSSWSTVATIGVALLGIGNALGFSAGLVAGAIISGAYFGDKMSPLSDTTNLAPAMAGTDLFTHIRYMSITTTPTILITLIIFLIIGFTGGENYSEIGVEQTLNTINSTFNISPILFIVPIVLIVMILKKAMPLPALFIATVLGGVFAVIFQPQIVKQIADISTNYATQSYIAVIKSMFGDVSIATDDPSVSNLLSTRGMHGMLNTIWLIITAMVFGGVMEACGLLERISFSIIQYAKTTTSLVASTVVTCLFFNVTASDQYLAIVVPGKMFAKTYRKRGLKPELLSRTLEDSGTVTSVLVPWNTCGATQSVVLGVPVLTFLPYAFFNIISPIMSIIIASLNFKIRRYSKEEMIEIECEKTEN